MTHPKLRGDLVVVPQVYRGDETYIIKDPETHKYFRFRPVEVAVMQEFTGDRTPEAVAAVLAELGLPFTAAAVEGFARKLGSMGLLERSVAERSVLLMERLRAERNRRLKRTHYTGSVLRMRWSVGDPDKFFDRWLPRLQFFFSRPFLVMSGIMFLVYGIVAVARWPELSHALANLTRLSAYTLGSFFLLYGTALCIICVHELGHGFTCKYFGGQVHEMGAMLIYFQPAFYCNVNDAWTFPELKARLWVTAAGSWIQLVLAGFAAMVWWIATPGTVVSQIALNAVIVGGVTTILANANPLIPLDGYYALSDWLEIPNLRSRAFGYLTWLVRRYALRLSLPPYPADDQERRVFLVYSVLALAYSTTILVLIVGALLGWLSRTVGAIGVIVLLVFLWAGVKDNAREWWQAVATSVREHRGFWRRPGRLRGVGIAVATVIVLGAVIPWPINVRGAFVAQPPLEVALTAPESAVIAAVLAREGAAVSAGAPVLMLRNFRTETEAVAQGRAADSLAQLERAALAAGRAAQATALGADRAEAEAERDLLRARLQSYTLRAPTAGLIVTPRLEERVGREVNTGDTLARLQATDSVELRVRLEPAGATLVAVGQRAALVPYSGVGDAVVTSVTSVSQGSAGPLMPQGPEARVRVAASAVYRSGVTGEAKIAVRRSNMWGALWWTLRKHVRSDLLL